MKKALIFAAVAEAMTGLALLLVPSLVGQLLLGEPLDRRSDSRGARGRYRPGRPSARLLAGSAASRHADLQCPCRALSCLPWRRSRLWRRPPLAGRHSAPPVGDAVGPGVNSRFRPEKLTRVISRQLQAFELRPNGCNHPIAAVEWASATTAVGQSGLTATGTGVTVGSLNRHSPGFPSWYGWRSLRLSRSSGGQKRPSFRASSPNPERRTKSSAAVRRRPCL